MFKEQYEEEVNWSKGSKKERDNIGVWIDWASQAVLLVQYPPANAGDVRDAGPSPGSEDPLEEGMETHSSILAWRIQWTEGPGGLQSTGSQRIRHDWSDLACTHAWIDSWGPDYIGHISATHFLVGNQDRPLRFYSMLRENKSSSVFPWEHSMEYPR